MKKFWRRLFYVILVLAVIHGIATFVLGRKVAAKFQSYRNRGEIVSVAELNGPKIPDAENGAILYQKAFDAYAKLETKDDESAIDDVIEVQRRVKNPAIWGQAKAAATKFESVFPLIDSAASAPKCSFMVDWNKGFAATFPHYSKMRSLTRLLCANAIVQAKEGNADGAAHSLVLAFKTGEAFKDEPILVGLLVRIAISSVASRTLQDVCVMTDLSDANLRELDAVLSGIDFTTGHEKALQSERALGSWFFTQLAGNPSALNVLNPEDTKTEKPNLLGAIIGWVWRPLLYADQCVGLDNLEKLIAYGRKPYRENIAEYKKEPVFPFYAIVSRIALPAFGRVAERTEVGKTMILCDRIFIALLLHKKQFGQYPNNLDELQGLENKIDPFSGKEFIYKRQDKGFLLYSIGENMKDEGARPWTPTMRSVPGSNGTRKVPNEAPAGFRYWNAQGQKVGDIVWEMNR